MKENHKTGKGYFDLLIKNMSKTKTYFILIHVAIFIIVSLLALGILEVFHISFSGSTSIDLHLVIAAGIGFVSTLLAYVLLNDLIMFLISDRTNRNLLENASEDELANAYFILGLTTEATDEEIEATTEEICEMLNKKFIGVEKDDLYANIDLADDACKLILSKRGKCIEHQAHRQL